MFFAAFLSKMGFISSGTNINIKTKSWIYYFSKNLRLFSKKNLKTSMISGVILNNAFGINKKRCNIRYSNLNTFVFFY